MVANGMRRVLAAFVLTCGGIGASSADEAWHHSNASLPAQPTWMSSLDDATPLHRLSLPGTYASAAWAGTHFDRAQTLTLRQQLDAGVRYLHIGVRGEGNQVLLSHNGTYQFRRFENVVEEVAGFLAANPRETVLVHPYRDEGKITGGYGLPELMNRYASGVAWASVGGVTPQTPLRALRGKIVWVREANVALPGIDAAHLRRQDDRHIDTHWSLYAKWEKVRANLDAAKVHPGGAIFLTNLGATGGAEPFFVASGREFVDSHRRRSTHQWRPFSNPFPDFPNEPCVLLPGVLCQVTYEGLNYLSLPRLRDESVRYTGIVAAAFPGQGLIGGTIDANRTQRLFVNAANGQCMDVEGGAGQARRILAWACHGGANQRVTLRDGQLKIGGRCVDIEAGNPNARVLSWNCHGGPNQRWTLDASGALRSALAGGAYCLTQAGKFAPLRMTRCVAGSVDQRFVVRL